MPFVSDHHVLCMASFHFSIAYVGFNMQGIYIPEASATYTGCAYPWMKLERLQARSIWPDSTSVRVSAWRTRSPAAWDCLERLLLLRIPGSFPV